MRCAQEITGLNSLLVWLRDAWLLGIVLGIWTTPLLWSQTDLWISNAGGIDSDYVFINEGNGTLNDSQQSLGKTISLSAAFGDFDNDGDIDVVDAADPGCWVYLNNGSGMLTQVSGFGADLPITRSIAVADLDGDQDLDIILGVAVSQFTSASQVFLNDGAANFSFKENVGTNDTRSIAVADLDGDTFPDIYEANRNQADRIWINDGSGSFSDSGQVLNSMASFSVALADVEMDGDLDALVAIDGAANQLWLNDGSGSFSASPQVFSSAFSQTCAFGDVDGDGDQDLVIGNDGAVNADTLEVWINDGLGAFTRNAQTSPNVRTVGMSLGDFDGDGDLDIYLANVGQDALWVNAGSGTFAQSPQSFPATFSNAGMLIFLRDDFQNAVAKWGQEYSLYALLQFQEQLTAHGDHRRGR